VNRRWIYLGLWARVVFSGGVQHEQVAAAVDFTGRALTAPLLVYRGCAWGDASISRETEQASSALTCRLAGMKLDKGNLQSGEPLEAEEGPSHHVCEGPF